MAQGTDTTMQVVWGSVVTAYSGPVLFIHTYDVFKKGGVVIEQTDFEDKRPSRWDVRDYYGWLQNRNMLSFNSFEVARAAAEWRLALWRPKWYHYLWRTLTGRDPSQPWNRGELMP